jgi:dephospho-CoA kinase
MTKSIVIEGPQGSGKTLASEALRKHYGLDLVVDLDDVKRVPRRGALILTHHVPPYLREAGLEIIGVEVAMRAAGVTLASLLKERKQS